MVSNAHFSRNKIQLGRFSYLLVSMILIMGLLPFLEGFSRIEILTDIFLSTMLLSAVYTASEKRRSFIITLVLAFSFLIFKWSNHLVETPWRWPLAEIFASLLIAYLLIFVLSFITRQQEVSTEVIMAAVCGYFLLGFMWSFLFLFLESVQPGAFQIAQNGTPDQSHFIYFSFVTMTTIGYGDTTPVSTAARSLAVLEAVMGQLYLAVTIARLVGVHVSQKQEQRVE